MAVVHTLLVPGIYLASAILFILGLKRLSRVRTARSGNGLAAVAMLLAVLGTLLELGLVDYRWIVTGLILGSSVGAFLATRVPMTAMPETVALLNGFGGGASALVAAAHFWQKAIEPAHGGYVLTVLGAEDAVVTPLCVLIGVVTLSGSLLAVLKLQGKIAERPVLLRGRHAINAALLLAALSAGVAFVFATAPLGAVLCLVLAGASLVLGVMLVLPIGGADMPVVISLLNSLSGVAAAATGFVLGNHLLIIGGALVGASGLFLTRIMCTAMNRSLANVVLGGFGVETASGATGLGPSVDGQYHNVRTASPEEAAIALESARSVVIVPGYGLAVAQAQHAVRELADWLQKHGTRVRYAIHPVAGRMPGHMNVLLAEANVPYDQLVEMERINPEFKETDVVLVIGANDVVNPAARKNPKSPLYGMPILDVDQARCVFVVKRGLGAGFAGIKNELFEYENTRMLFGDAKAALQDLLGELKGTPVAAGAA